MKQIQLTAFDSNNQLARLSLVERSTEANGLHMDITIVMAGFEAKVSTFFFGYNLANFSAELELLEVGERQTSKLLNFDESLILSLSQTKENPPLRYAFLSYQVPNPHPPKLCEVPVDPSISTFGLDGGTRVSVAFLRVHDRAGDIAKVLDELISESGTGTENPYGGDE